MFLNISQERNINPKTIIRQDHDRMSWVDAQVNQKGKIPISFSKIVFPKDRLGQGENPIMIEVDGIVIDQEMYQSCFLVGQ